MLLLDDSEGKMLISVLIPAYNVEAYIEKCLTSLFENSYAPMTRFIVCNDASTDGTAKKLSVLCKKYAHLSITVLTNEMNQGIAKTRNILLHQAHTKYFLFVDADDWVGKRFLDCLYENALSTHADIIYYCKFYCCLNNATHIIQQASVKNSLEAFENLLQDNIKGNLWVQLLKTTVVKQHNIFFSENICYEEDLLFLLKCYLHAESFVPINSALYNYNKNNANSITSSPKNIKERCNSTQVFLQEIKSYLKDLNCFTQFEDAYIVRCLTEYLRIMTNTPIALRYKYRNLLGHYKHLPLKILFNPCFHNRLIAYCYANHLFFIALFIQAVYKVMHKIREITPPHQKVYNLSALDIPAYRHVSSDFSRAVAPLLPMSGSLKKLRVPRRKKYA